MSGATFPCDCRQPRSTGLRERQGVDHKDEIFMIGLSGSMRPDRTENGGWEFLCLMP